MSYNSSANVYVTNNSGGTANITLSHCYSTDPTVQATWENVAPGAVVGPLVAGYNTGFIRSGADWWWIGLQVTDGASAGNYASEGSADQPGKQCALSDEDDGKRLDFSVDTETFVMTEVSGTCSTSVSSVG